MTDGDSCVTSDGSSYLLGVCLDPRSVTTEGTGERLTLLSLSHTLVSLWEIVRIDRYV